MPVPKSKKGAASTTQVKEIVLPPFEGEGVTVEDNGASEALNTIAKQKAESTPEVVIQSDKKDPNPEPTPVVESKTEQPVSAGISPEQLDSMLESKLQALLEQKEAERQKAEKEAELLSELERLRNENSELKAKSESAEQQMSNVEALTGITGRGAKEAGYNPNVLAQLTSRTDYQPPLVKELFEAIESAPKHEKNYEDQFFAMPDSRVLDRHVSEHVNEAKAKYGRPFNTVRELQHLPLYKELESWAKNQGLFRGDRGGVPITQAPVTSADMVGGFLPTLSAMLRYTHRGAYIFWQFPNVSIDHGRNRGDTIKIARYALNEEPPNNVDWELSGGGAFADLTTDSQGTQTGVVDAVIKEYGMGKVGVNANRPYMVPNFVQMYSMLSVLESFQVNLMRNYMQFEDRYIRALWEPTSRVVYNNANEVELTVGNVVDNSDGTLTAEFLHSLYTYMAAQYIPTYMDGCYGLACNSYQIQQLRKSMTPIERDGFTTPSNAADLASLVNMLPAITDTDRITGYRGRWGNFHIFEQNTFGMGAAGTPGAQTVTTGATTASQLARTAYAFGANTIGRGIGMPMELRSQSGEILWNRAQKWIWISHESFAALDVDPTGYSDASAVPQQLRVLEVRTLDKPV